MSKLFKTKREDLGRGISEVAASTRIKESCLVAIEEEDYDKLPIEVYARGYIKEYSKYLSLPVEDGLFPYEKYLEMKKSSKEPKEKKQPLLSEHPASGPQKENEFQEQKTSESFCKEVKLESAPSHSPNKPEVVKNYGNKFLWKGFLLLIVVLAIAYQFISSRNAAQESHIVPMTQQVEPPKEVSPNAATPPPESSLPPAGEVNTPAIVPVNKKHELVISAEDTSWVQVIMDGSERKESLMKRGERLTVGADKTMTVIIGNAGGVSLKFDGKDLPQGKNGEVLRLTLPEKPKSEKPSQDFLSLPPKKPSAPVKQEPNVSNKSADEKTPPIKLPEQPTSTSKP